MVIDDEFRFLSSDAQRIGRVGPLPTVERISATVGEHRRLSALRFHPEAPAEFVMLHGAGLNAHSFDPTLLALDRPAISLDLPGHGRSDWRTDGDYRPDHLSDDVTTALEHLTSSPVTLVGHSLGGLTAALTAATIPERVSHLVIIDITPGITPSSDASSVTEFITGQRDYGTIDEIVERAIRFGIGSDPVSLTRGVTLNTRRRDDGRFEWTHHLAHLDGLPADDPADPQPYAPIWASLQSLDIPVTLMRASSGIVSEALAAEWSEQLPGSTILTLAGPHNLHEASPRELSDALRGLATARH